MKKKFRINGFAAFLLVYASFLILLITCGLYYVWNLLIDYEAGMPDVNMEKFLVEFEAGNIETLLSKYPVSVNEYDTEESVEKAYVSMVENQELTYKKLTGKYTNATPVYEIYAGDDIIAVASLSETGKNKHGFSVWDMANVTFDGYGPVRESVSIKVPGSAVVTVNGTVIDEKYLTETQPVEMTASLSDYVEWVPEYKIYRLENLIQMPQVEVSGDYIKEVSDTEYTVAYDFDTDESLKEEAGNRIMAMAHEYGAYIINKGNLGTLKSYMVGKAREYVSNIPAVWAYLWNEEYSFNFTNEEIGNFVRYGEDCFGCEVSYTLNVFYRTTRSISYDTHIRCMYVKKDGMWYLADFILENE
ncbi:MAG: hypothetical protein PUF12_07990 [Thermoflexaceae bacterium]|nr:hypothetical protein [Thermoflexaceae bacterium]